MNGALEVLKQEFGGLRTGRASASLLEPVLVEAYGSQMPLNQLATISVPESRLLTVQVWDKGMVKAIEKAIQSAGLGLNPSVEGQLLRVPIPELNEERRVEMTRVAGKYAEQARVAVRNVRRDGMEKLKKEGDLSQDDQHLYGDEIQSMTDRIIGLLDEALATKETEIMQV
ncbi:MAG: ribosome recycling factor [Alphaproteobacteria bacterium]|nr:ribosome recycling factor [Alphaproteobacteria bacterium]